MQSLRSASDLQPTVYSLHLPPMFLAHSFRLRDPWQREAQNDGAVRWTRLFHRPTGLEPDDALWLVISGLPEGARVTLNGQPLAPLEKGTGSRPEAMNANAPKELTNSLDSDPPNIERACPLFQWDVTALLADSNQVEITIPSDLQPPTSSLQPAFPYDARLGIVGHS
jgi:hypothetical protein